MKLLADSKSQLTNLNCQLIYHVL